MVALRVCREDDARIASRGRSSRRDIPNRRVIRRLPPASRFGPRLGGQPQPMESRTSDARDVGGDEVDTVAVEVAAGAVVVLCRARVGVPRQDLGDLEEPDQLQTVQALGA